MTVSQERGIDLLCKYE